MKTKNLTPADKNAWKKSVEDHNKNYTVTEEIFEILGSMKDSTTINIKVDEQYIRVFHNGEPIDNNDMKRLMNVYTHNIKNNKKGTSQQGIGWRAVASSCSQGNINDYTHDNHGKYSFMISKTKDDILIEDDVEKLEYNKNDIISIVHAQEFYVNYINEKDTDLYRNIYEKYLKNEYGVFFQVPNTKPYDIDEISSHLKILFNRFDGTLFLNGKDILKKRKFHYIDSTIKDTRYLDIDFSLYTHKKSKIVKMTINLKKDIDRLTKNEYYLNMKTVASKVNENLKLQTLDDWMFKGNIDELEPDDYYVKCRTMGFNPDKHDKGSDFAEWYGYYTSAGKFIGDGILPYIDDICLRYNLDDRRKGYIKREGVSTEFLKKNGGKLIPEKHINKEYTSNYGYTPSLNVHRRWGDTGKQKERHTDIPVILSKNDKYIKYKPNQNYLCEMIETREMCDSEHSLINKTARKTESTCTDSSTRGYGQTLPYFITFLMTEYIWFRDKEESIKTEEQKEEEVLEAKKKTELAIKQAQEAYKATQIAENKVRIEHAARKIAEQKATMAKKETEIAEHEKKTADIKKHKTMVLNQKLAEVLEEQAEATEELKKEVEEKYVPNDDETNVKDGYCYCLKDLTRPMWRKIGYSSQNKDKLLKQYPSRFFPLSIEVIHWSEYKEAKLAEKNIFIKLDKYRNKNTEWFFFKDIDEDKINIIVGEEFVKVQSFMVS